MNKTQQKLKNTPWTVGDKCGLGTITEFFTSNGEINFFTESGAFFPLRYLHGERKRNN